MSRSKLTVEQADELLAAMSDDDVVKTVLEVAFAVCSGANVNPPWLVDAPLVKWVVRHCKQSERTPEEFGAALQLFRNSPEDQHVTESVAGVKELAVDHFLVQRAKAATSLHE